MTTRGFRYSLTEHRLPKHLRAWTLDEVRKLRELAQQGRTVVEIARELRRTLSAVASRAATHGITLPTKDGLRRRTR